MYSCVLFILLSKIPYWKQNNWMFVLRFMNVNFFFFDTCQLILESRIKSSFRFWWWQPLLSSDCNKITMQHPAAHLQTCDCVMKMRLNWCSSSSLHPAMVHCSLVLVHAWATEARWRCVLWAVCDWGLSSNWWYLGIY